MNRLSEPALEMFATNINIENEKRKSPTFSIGSSFASIKGKKTLPSIPKERKIKLRNDSDNNLLAFMRHALCMAKFIFPMGGDVIFK